MKPKPIFITGLLCLLFWAAIILCFASWVCADTAHVDTLLVKYDAHRNLGSQVVAVYNASGDSVTVIGESSGSYSGYFLFEYTSDATGAEIDSVKFGFKNQLARTSPAFKFIFKCKTGAAVTITDSTAWKTAIADSTADNEVWESSANSVADQWYYFDVTDCVKEWVTEAVGDSIGLFMQDNGSAKYFHAFAVNDISEAAAPQLIIYWTESGDTPDDGAKGLIYPAINIKTGRRW